MIREICEALESLTIDRTFVLLFEDLHWADHSTVDLISAIARRRGPARILLLGTYRPVDIVLAHHPLKQMSQALKAHHLCREVVLPSLAEADISEYLVAQSSSSEESGVRRLARWIQRHTEGNPLFMITLIEHLERSGHIGRENETWSIPPSLDDIDLSVPDTLRQMIELQIELLSPREQLALGAASAQGMVFSAPATAAVLELDLEDVEDTCHKLAQYHHMIRDAGEERLTDGSFSRKYEFVHALFRSVFYQRLTPARRTKLHRRFAEVISDQFQDRRAEIAAQLAGHYEQAGDVPNAVECLRLTAQNAWRRYAYPEAILIAERGLQLTEHLPQSERVTWELRFREMLGVLALAAHEPARALQALEALASSAAGYGVADVEARALTYMMVLRGSSDSRACVPIFDRLQALSCGHKGPLAICAFGWNAQLAEEHAGYLAAVRKSGDRVSIAMEQMDHGWIEWLSSQYALCIEHVQQSLPMLLECGQVNGRHSVVITTALITVDVFRIRNTYDLLIARHQAVEAGNRGRVASKVIFRGRQGCLPLDLTGAEKDMADQILPEFFNKAGERIEIPPALVAVVKAAVRGANCIGCTHQHFVAAPKLADAMKMSPAVAEPRDGDLIGVEG